MQREEMETEIRKRREATLFVPFVIELTSGELVEVDDPDAIGFGGGAAGFMNAEGEPIDFDCFEIVRISDVSAAATA